MIRQKTAIFGAIFFCVASTALAVHAQALFTSSFSLTDGYWEGINRTTQRAMLFDWKVNHLTPSGIETTADLGYNNDINQGTWTFFPYEVFVTIPFERDLESHPYFRSRAQLGRQLFTEGFELKILDGIQLPYYWSSGGGVWLFAGSDHVLEDTDLSFASRIYGVSLFQTFQGFQAKAGYMQKGLLGGAHQNLVHAQVSRTFETLPLDPTVFVKGQAETQDFSRADQAVTELQILPSQNTTVDVDYQVRRSSRSFVGSGDQLYNLFAISPVKSSTVSGSWWPSWNLGFSTHVQRLSYFSRAGREVAYLASIDSTHRIGHSSFSPGVTAIDSYGLWSYSLGGKYRLHVTDTVQFVAEVDAARIHKINRINGWAYHERSGFDFSPLPQLLARILLELESNHLLAFDARLAAYVSYFYF